jgi:hypothetical protein
MTSAKAGDPNKQTTAKAVNNNFIFIEMSPQKVVLVKKEEYMRPRD